MWQEKIDGFECEVGEAAPGAQKQQLEERRDALQHAHKVFNGLLDQAQSMDGMACLREVYSTKIQSASKSKG